jgi:hypothetical protein
MNAFHPQKPIRMDDRKPISLEHVVLQARQRKRRCQRSDKNVSLYIVNWYRFASADQSCRKTDWRCTATRISSLSIMADIDVAQEWRRLQDVYAGMSEEELQAVANQGYELTDIAKQALTAEISRRGLKVVVRLAPPENEDAQPVGDPEFDPADLDLGFGFTVESREQAEWVKKTLNDAGIPCYFGPDLRENSDSLEFAADHPISVSVLKNDLSRLPRLLTKFGERFPSKQVQEPVDLTVHCPECNSTDIVLHASDTEGSEDAEDVEEGEEDAEQLELAVPGSKFSWHCEACGYQWEDDGVES